MGKSYWSWFAGTHLAVGMMLVLMACGPDGAYAAPAPYKGEPDHVALTDDDHARLNRNESVTKELNVETGKGVKVLRINASADKIWSVILDFNNYSKWNSKIQKETHEKRRDGDNIFVEFHVRPMVLTGVYVYHIEHYHPKNADWMTWKNEEAADLPRDIVSVGFWRIQKVDDNHCNVVYSVTVDKDNIPLLLRGLISTFIRSGLDDATSWVKKASES